MALNYRRSSASIGIGSIWEYSGHFIQYILISVSVSVSIRISVSVSIRI